MCIRERHLRLHCAHDELGVLALLVDHLADVSQLVLHTQQLALKHVDLWMHKISETSFQFTFRRAGATCRRSWSAILCETRHSVTRQQGMQTAPVPAAAAAAVSCS